MRIISYCPLLTDLYGLVKVDTRGVLSSTAEHVIDGEKR